MLPEDEKNLKWVVEEGDDDYRLGASRPAAVVGTVVHPINHHCPPGKAELLPELIQRCDCVAKSSGHRDKPSRSTFMTEGLLPLVGGSVAD